MDEVGIINPAYNGRGGSVGTAKERTVHKKREDWRRANPKTGVWSVSIMIDRRFCVNRWSICGWSGGENKSASLNLWVCDITSLQQSNDILICEAVKQLIRGFQKSFISGVKKKWSTREILVINWDFNKWQLELQMPVSKHASLLHDTAEFFYFAVIWHCNED